MSLCDAAYFCKGWENARGCRLEHDAAVAYGLEIIYESDSNNKQTVVFDFDGVIHSYASGWKGAIVIPDEPVPGIKEAMIEIYKAGYEIVVVSTRCNVPEGARAVVKYLREHEMLPYVKKVCKEKPPAIVYIDDRAINFDGNANTLLEKIKSFQPWYKKPAVEQVNHPTHYNAPGRKECIEEMIDEFGKENVELWCRMTAYKYDYRAGSKEGNSKEQDMAKRKWYLDKAEELQNTTEKVNADAFEYMKMLMNAT